MTEDAMQSAGTPNQSRRKALSLKTKETDLFLSVPCNDPKKKHIVEVRSLLSELVNTTAAVLTSRPVHVWQVYGGFQRIYEAVLHIFYHGCVHKDTQGNPDVWPFIVGLRVLSPVLGPSNEATTVPKPAEKWIHSSLQKLQLAVKIAALTADRDHVEKHYHHWALLRSDPHITAVKTCLKALEENSQDGLADIDPKLLVGDYYPPPGTPVIGRPDAADKLSRLKAQLHDPAISKISVINPFLFPSRGVTSLPTTPVGERDRTSVWPFSDQSQFVGNPKTRALGRSASHEAPESKQSSFDPNHALLEGLSHPPIRRGKSEASLQIHRKDIARAGKKSRGMTNMEEHSASFMCRESPDGSSGSSDWPLTSPVSQSVPFVKKESPQVISGSPIARLVKGELLSSQSETTGAKPKEYHATTTPQQLKSHHISHHNLDVSDSSEPGSSISPSLLQVNYGGKYSPSEGEASSSSLKGSGATCSLEIKTPQVRRRASNGRLGSGHADSDQDSEETVDGNVASGSRRRRRPTVSQHRSSMSVKLLVDSRGVLGTESERLNCASASQSKNLTKSQTTNIGKTKETALETGKDHHSSACSLAKKSEYMLPAQHLTKSSASKPIKTSNLSTPVKTLSDDISGLLASSAPGTVIKGSLSPYDETSKMQKKTHSRSRSDGSQEIVGKLKLATSNTAPTLETGMKLGDDTIFGSQIRKRFMDDGGHSITPAADYGVSPRPQPGQSLIGFLASKDKPYAELDRENAHFNISEAVIAALTQMQFDVWQGKKENVPGAGDESDEEIRILEARIREKRRLKQSGSFVTGAKPIEAGQESSSDPQQWVRSQPFKGESTTDYSMYESPQSSTYNSESDLLSELEEDSESHVSQGNTPISSRKTSSTEQPSLIGDLTSAESVAINLLKRFSEQKLPKASELDWLVSEQDVPQKLLPLPTSVAVSPDDADVDKEMELQMQLRGTMDWAPPRPQLILTLHMNTKRSLLMGMQRWRCAGCGMRVSESLSRHFRLCHYLGRYFCTTCHRNQTAMIPAKVLHKWDFRLYPVASFSSELLERMKIDPLINVGALNPGLYKKCRHLHQTHIYRLQLYHTLPYINTCSRSHSERRTLGKLPIHWASDPHVYSLDDLNCIRAGQLVNSIKDVTSLCIRHIAKCEVCLGRGFICEVCCRGEAIFPFQLDSTSLCEICSACYHAGCFSPNRCPRCIRRESRRMSHDLLNEVDTFESSIELEKS